MTIIIGHNVEETTDITTQINTSMAQKHTCPEDMILVTMYVWIQSNFNDTRHMRMGIYSDGGANPDVLLGETLEKQGIGSGSGLSARWWNIAMATPLRLDGGVDYWLAYIVDNAFTTLQYTVGGIRRKGTNPYASGFVSPWVNIFSDTIVHSMYGEGDAPPPPLEVGVLTSSGTLVKKTSRSFAGTLTISGTLRNGDEDDAQHGILVSIM
jgi:hypothetical protein